MKIQVKTSIGLGKDETSKKLAELIKNGEKIFWKEYILEKRALGVV